MADRSSERDRRVRQLMGNKNPGFDVLGQAQAEIQDAQSELYNHIALQNAQEQSRLQETSTISQAAAGMLSMEGGDQLQYQAATMNPSTQATLGKYGVKPSQTQNSSRNSTSQRYVTKSGDTTNIRNENITNNRTDIRVTQPSIPIQQPVIPMRSGGGGKEDSTAKFKAWLSGMFARQQNEAEIQRKEYRKKEWALGRTTSKLMKKIGDATSNLGNRLDPKNISSSLGGQIKWLLLIFGATMIGKVWKPAMQFLANLEGGFRAAFGLPMNDDLRNASSKSLSIIDQIKEAIGIDPRKDKETTLIKGIGMVFMEGIDKLIDKLEFWFEDRAASMKEVEFPKVKVSALHPYDSIVNAVKGMGQYLGDVITVAFGGSKGKVRVEASKVERESQATFTNTKGKQTSAGDSALMTGKGRNYMRDSDYDTWGNLKGNAGTTQAMSQSIISMFNDNSGKGHTAEIATGVSQLFKTAKRQGQVVIDPELLNYLGLGQQDLVALQRSGNLTQKPYRIIPVNPTEAQKTELGAYDGNWGLGVASGVGAGLGAWGGAVLGAKAGAAIGSIGGPVGTGVGAAIGGIGGGLIGFFGGGTIGAGAGAGIDKLVRDWSSKGYYPVIVPEDSNQIGADGTRGVRKPLWVLDSKGVDIVKGKLASVSGMGEDENMDLTSKNFYNYLRKRGETIARQRGRALGRENIDTSNLNRTQAQYSYIQDEYNRRFNTNNPDSPYKHWNAASNTVSGWIDSGLSAASSALTWTGGQVLGMKIGRGEQNQRAAWLMKKAMEYGFTKEQAAGIAGNAMRESGMITETAYNSNDGGQPGGGLAGWRGDNCKQILKYARDLYGYNVNPDNIQDIKKVSFEDQADILLRTLTGELDYGNGFGKRAGNAIRKATTVADATRAMERKYEVSGDYSKDNLLTKRTEFANGFYQINLSTVDTSTSALGSPISVGGDDGMMVGKSGSTPSRIKDWLWGGHAPEEYKKSDQSRANSLMTTIKVPIHNSRGEEGIMSITINKKLSENVTQIFNDIFTKVPDFKIDPDSTGGYCFRAVNTGKGYSQKLSNHSLGGAIDINWNINKLNDTSSQDTNQHLGTSKHPVVQIFCGNGWIWGGNWGNKDKMHFEYGGGVSIGGGIVNDFLDVAGSALISAGEYLDPNKSSESNPLIRPLTSDQQNALGALNTYETLSNQVKSSALARGGVRVDEFGMYVDTGGGLNAYIKEDSIALNGALTADDVSFVAKKDDNGRLKEVSEEEKDLAKNSIRVSMNSVFSTYTGKGSSNDRMKKGNDDLIFNLGEFKDIEGFSDYAQEKLKGKIRFWVCPTKDGSDLALIKIEKFISRFNVDLETTKVSREDLNSLIYVGPIIYDLGRKWINPFKENSEATDWQPAAIYERVRLTPEANLKKQKLLQYISLGAITEKDGKLYAGDKKLSDEEFDELKEFGIITKTRYRVGSRHNTGFGANYGAVEGYNSAISTAKTVIAEGGKFKTEEYLNSLGTTVEDYKNFFNKNKDNGAFVYREGQIFGPGGAIWGTYTTDDKGNRVESLFDLDTFAKTQQRIGNEGLKRNDFNNRMDLVNKALAKTGGLNYNAVGDFTRQISGVDLLGEDSDLTNKVAARIKRQNGGKVLTDIIGKGVIAGKKFNYYMFLSPTGEITNYKVRKQDLLKLINEITGSEQVETAYGVSDIQAKDRGELFNEVLRQVASARVKLDQDDSEFHDLDTDRRIKTDIATLSLDSESKVFDYSDQFHTDGTAPTFDKLASYLIRKGELIDHIDTPGKEGFFEMAGRNDTIKDAPAIVYYRNGNTERLGKDQGYWFPEKNCITQDWWDKINKKIEEIKNAGTLEKAIKVWDSKDNNYLAGLQDKVEAAKRGELKVTYNQDHTVTDEFGTIIDTWEGDKVPTGEGYHGKGGITSETLSSNDDLAQKVIREQGTNYFNNNGAARALFFMKYFNAVPEGGDLWVYSANGTFRTKIRSDISVEEASKDMKNVFDKRSTQAKSGGKWINLTDTGKYASYDKATGEFKDTGYFGSNLTGNDNILQTGFDQIVAGLGNINDTVDLGNAYSEVIAGNSDEQVDQGTLAAKQTIAQITKAKEQVASAQRSERYLQSLAENGFSLSPEDRESLKASIEQIDLRAKSESIIESAKAVGVKGVSSGTKMYTASLDDANKGKSYIVENGKLYVVKKNDDGTLSKYATTNVKDASVDSNGNIVWTNNDNKTYTITVNQVTTLPKSTANSDGSSN